MKTQMKHGEFRPSVRAFPDHKYRHRSYPDTRPPVPSTAYGTGDPLPKEMRALIEKQILPPAGNIIAMGHERVDTLLIYSHPELTQIRDAMNKRNGAVQ